METKSLKPVDLTKVTLTSSRSVTIAMNRLDALHTAKGREAGVIRESWRGRGVGEGDFDKIRAIEAEQLAIYGQIDKLHNDAKAVGVYVSVGVHHYANSTHAELVRNNID